MLPRGARIICTIQDMLPGVDLYYTDPAQYLIMIGSELDDLDRDLSDLSVRLDDLERYLSDLSVRRMNHSTP